MAGQETTETLLNAVNKLEPLIRKHADEAEQNRHLSHPVVDALAEAGFFRLYTPRTLGGLEVDPLTFTRVVEALARIDGSTAWCVWLASTNPLFVPNLMDTTVEEIFGRNPNVVTAGVILPYGKAEVRDGGYTASGRWSYASGVEHCTWIFTLCNVFDGEQMRRTESGEPAVYVVFVPTAQITILDTWQVSGLAGTGSQDVEIRQVFVPEKYVCPLNLHPSAHGKHFRIPLYRYPFLVLGFPPIGAIALGIAQGAVDACLDLARAKRPSGVPDLLRDQPVFQVRLAEAVALVRSARAWIHTAIQQACEAQDLRGQVSLAERTDVLLAAANATRSAAAAVDILYTAGGGTANYRHSPLQRALRDVHAVTQHWGTAPRQFESAGRMLVGLPPLNPMIMA
jgi:alkylation response protein AidB-like acyl-CoA dehydrogenase